MAVSARKFLRALNQMPYERPLCIDGIHKYILPYRHSLEVSCVEFFVQVADKTLQGQLRGTYVSICTGTMNGTL